MRGSFGGQSRMSGEEAPIEIDARGLLCPLPVLRLRKVLLAQIEGTEVRLLATDPVAVIDVPHFCAQGGHALLETRDLGAGVSAFRVKRGPDMPEAASTQLDPDHEPSR